MLLITELEVHMRKSVCSDIQGVLTERNVRSMRLASRTNISRMDRNLCYTCLSILMASFNYRARATFDPSTLNYSLNGAANEW